MPELTITQETAAPIDLVWKMAKRGSELMPKVMPDYFANVEILEGDGGAGTLRVVTLGEGVDAGSAGAKVKERFDVVDDATHTMSYSTVEGGDPRYTAMRFTVRFSAAGADSTSVESTVSYTTADDSVPPPEHLRGFAHALLNAMASYAKDHAAEFQ